jgi:hypothetical protein
VRRMQDENNDLRATFEALRVEHASLEARFAIQDAARQQEWKLDRLNRENKYAVLGLACLSAG